MVTRAYGSGMNHARRGGIAPLFVLGALCAGVTFAPGRSAGGEMDITLSRFVLDPACATWTTPPTPIPGMTPQTCNPNLIDQDAFRFLASQLGAVFAPKLMAP